jgi:DNA helicase II / ATP-dependent DNA helicase PcrA
LEEKIKLDKFQSEAVNHGEGPLLIIAGAGTGKTTVITERIKHLIINKNAHPSEVLALTFTEKASAEMEERVDLEMPYGYNQMWISTFHAFCDRILRQEAIHIGLNPGYKLTSEAETVLLLRKNIFKFNLSYFRPLGNPDKFLNELLSHFSRLKDEDVDEEQYLKFAKNLSLKKDVEKEEKEKSLELANAFKTYKEIKIKENVMDFSDLISNTLKLFRTRKNILKNYQDQFKYVLVDEFQDTNYAQNELAILLSGEKKNITVVGDDDQSIYRFRGSSVSNIIQFRKHFPKAKIVTLINNYRSTKEILDRSYQLIQFNNPDRLEVKEKINKKLISARNIKGESVEFIFAQRAEDEADLVAQKIKELCKDEKTQYKDVAILVRANDHAQNFVRALERKKIPYQFLGPGRLFHQEEIKDLIAYLKILYNFEDSTALYRVLNMDIFKFESIEIASLLNYAKRKNYSLFETLEKIDETFLRQDAKEKVKKLVILIKKHLSLVPKKTAGEILYYFLTDTNLLNKIVEYKTENEEKKAKNIAKFFDKLKTHETEHETATVFDIVDWIDLSMQMGESPLVANLDWTENNAVSILSVHSSKGLEFPIVFLINLVSDRFPTRNRSEAIPIPQDLIKEILPSGDYHLQEERRLFYVGMTRAKDKLFLTAALFYGEGKRKKKISSFVYEALDEKTVEKIIKQKNETSRQMDLLEWIAPKENVEEKGLTKLPLSYLSYSQIQTFEICPLHYKLKYILKIPTPPSPAQSFGISCHNVLRDFYQMAIRGENVKISMADDLIKKRWINEGYSSKSHEKEALVRAKRIIESYLKNNFDPKKVPFATEYSFNFFINDLKIIGIMDRVDGIGGKIEILDYKTGTNIPTQKEVDSNLQLTIYAMAVSEVKEKFLGKAAEDMILSLYYLEKETKLTTTRTKEQLEEAKKEILEIADKISKSDFKCSGSALCQKCEYKMLCQGH